MAHLGNRAYVAAPAVPVMANQATQTAIHSSSVAAGAVTGTCADPDCPICSCSAVDAVILPTPGARA
eukprot:7788938-Lingulodinium_polyedra.AAC.1